MRSGPKKYRLYVIHGQGTQSHDLVALLQAHPAFEFADLSIADGRLADGSREKIARVVRKRIGQADAVLALTTPAASRSAWIKFQLDAAKLSGARVIGVVPSEGAAGSPLVRTYASRIVGWDAGAIVGAVLSRRPPSASPVSVAPVAAAPVSAPKPARSVASKPVLAAQPAPVLAKPAQEVARPSSAAGSFWGRLFGRKAAKAF